MRPQGEAQGRAESMHWSSWIEITVWRGGRVVECTGLENQQRFVAFRGFESHPLRQKSKRPLLGPFAFLAEFDLGIRSLFESSTGEAGIEDAQRPSHLPPYPLSDTDPPPYSPIQ